MKDLGVTNKILSMEIKKDRVASKFYVTQEGYLVKVLRKYGMFDAKPVSVTMG